MNIDRYFKLAKNASIFSDYDKIHIGSVLVYKNRIIAVGYNTKQSHTMQKRYNKYRNTDNRQYDVDSQLNGLHSEMKCLVDTKDLKINWSKVTLFIYREYADGSLAPCYPCQACIMALNDRGIQNIFYTDKNGYNYEYLEQIKGEK